jgi:hypothetical protein
VNARLRLAALGELLLAALVAPAMSAQADEDATLTEQPASPDPSSHRDRRPWTDRATPVAR